MIGIPNRRSHKPMCEIFQFTLPYNSPTGTAISFSETIPLIRRMIGKGNDLRQLNSQLKRRPPVGGGGGCAQSESVRQWQSGVIRWRRATQSGIMRQQGRTPPSMYQLVLWQSCILSYYLHFAPCTLHPVSGSNAIWESVPCNVHTHCAFLPFIFSLTGPTSYRNLVLIWK